MLLRRQTVLLLRQTVLVDLVLLRLLPLLRLLLLLHRLPLQLQEHQCEHPMHCRPRPRRPQQHQTLASDWQSLRSLRAC